VIETALNTWLRANIASVAGRVYPRKLPQGCTLPALTYLEISGDRWRSHQGPSGVAEGRYQISCWTKEARLDGTDYLGAKTLADEVITALDCYTGLMDTKVIQACFYVGQRDLGSEAGGLHASEAGLHMVALDFYIWWEE
jgi:hypothetical protein